MAHRLATALLAASILASSPSLAQDEVEVAKAKVLFIEGVELFKDGKHAQALEKFEASYALRPHWRLHLNIGLCFMELSMYTKAKAAFDAFVTEGKDEIQKSEHKQVKAELAKLEKIIAVLEIRIETPGAVVELDGRNVVEEAAAGPIDVDPGSHVIKAFLEGHEPHRDEFLVSKGERRTFEIVLVPLEQEGPVEPVEPGPPSRSKAAFWVMGSLTVALAAGAVATGVLALQKHDDVTALDEETGDLFDSGGYSDAAYEAYMDEREPMVRSGKTLGTLTTALMAASGAALVGTIVAGVLTRPFSKHEQPVQVAPVPIDEGGMLVVAGSF